MRDLIRRNFPVIETFDHLFKSFEDRWLTFSDFFEDNTLIKVFQNYATPKIDIIDEPEKRIYKFSVPGLTKNDINIDINKNERYFTISSELKTDKENKKENFLWHEISQYSFKESYNIDKNINVDNVKANLKDGILEIEFAKVEKEPEKKIEKIEITS